MSSQSHLNFYQPGNNKEHNENNMGRFSKFAFVIYFPEVEKQFPAFY